MGRVARGLAVVAAVLLAGACSTASPAAPPPDRPALPVPAGPPRLHGSFPELLDAVNRSTLRDGTSVAVARSRGYGGGRPAATSGGRVEVVQGGPGGRGSVRLRRQDQDPGTGQQMLTELVLLPDEAYLRPDRAVWPEPRPPWLRLDPAGRDPVSARYAPLLALQRRSQGGLGCLTELGSVSITGTARARSGDVDVIRYDLLVRLDGTATDPATSASFRGLGATTATASVDVDGDDRERGCRGRVAAPGGATVETDQELVEAGRPLSITAPPPDQVLRLPAGR